MDNSASQKNPVLPLWRMVIFSLILWTGVGCGFATESAAAPKEIALDAKTPSADLSVAALGYAEALPKMLALERQAILDGDVKILEALWHIDAQIVDARGTAGTEDNFVWDGRPAILDRYFVAVFDNPPPLLDEADVVLQLDSAPDSRGTLANETELRGSSGTDQWRFVWQDGRWWILELVYGQP